MFYLVTLTAQLQALFCATFDVVLYWRSNAGSGFASLVDNLSLKPCGRRLALLHTSLSVGQTVVDVPESPRYYRLPKGLARTRS